MRLQAVLLGVLGALVVGLAVLVVVIYSTASAHADQQDVRLAKVRSEQTKQLGQLRTEVRSMKTTAPASTSLDVKVSKLQARVRQLENCLPEVQNQLNSLELNDGYVYIRTQISRVCYETLYPDARGE